MALVNGLRPPGGNPVYLFGGTRYREVFALPAVDDSFLVGPIPWVLPWRKLPLWTRRTLKPFGLLELGRAFYIFDTPSLVEMARKGVDFGAAGLVAGLRPAGRDQGTPEQWARFGSTMLPEMLATGQARRVWDPGEVARVIVHPVAIVKDDPSGCAGSSGD